ncbi:hypothetical protein HG530_007273 [Fusarium avenaceum]|nr:hypothetical protein HG530_007273 [Fusarium avenaceum]
MFTKSRKHAACNTNHVLHLRTHQAQNSHVAEHAHITTLCELLGNLAKGLDLLAARVDGHGDVHLGSRNEVDRDGVGVENAKDAGKETKVSSAASEGVIDESRRAVGTLEGSAEKMPSTSFQTWSSSALTPTAQRAAHRDIAEETSDDGDAALTGGNLAGKCLRSGAVELVVESASSIIVE